MSELRRAIAIDFDGCLCKNMWPNIGLPNFDAINAAIRAKQEGAALILWTCRVGEKLENAIQFCKSYGLEFDAVNDNLPERVAFYSANPRKVNADEYWDDLSVFVSAAADEGHGRFMGGPGDNSIKIIKPAAGGFDSLDPCPFCDGTEVVYEAYDRGVGERWRCWCTSCLASIDPGWAQDRMAVRSMWNRRVISANDPLSLVELRKMQDQERIVWLVPLEDGAGWEAQWKKLRYKFCHRVDYICVDLLERPGTFRNLREETYGKTWLAYRCKPEEVR